jgi:hypothetical protein
MRRATIAVVDKLNPIATENTRLSIDSVKPTVATAFAPSRPYPENVHHPEQRLQHHLQHHGHGQQQNGAVQAAAGVILMRAANGFEQ